MYNTKSAVLFLIFNRPQQTRKVFDKIRLAKPSRLYIAADGPRANKPKEKELCSEALEILENIDWDCDVKTLIRSKNLGCRKAVSEAITWYFENESEGIIIEDDCLPASQFFQFCDEMLERYRHDDRIRHISGSKYLNGFYGEETYCFSRLSHIWGWASWARVWAEYDVNMQLLPIVSKHQLNDLFKDRKVVNYLFKQFELTYFGYIDTWDYQYTFSNLIASGLSISPRFNLISNIGFDSQATHTIDVDNEYANLKIDEYQKIIHPHLIIPSTREDVKYIKTLMPPLKIKFKQFVKDILYKWQGKSVHV